ncbi:cbb3-type cytochrome c oxidase N-terminal domain-containing protein [Dokdonia sp. Asnod3-C12]|uniref:cbb3-type cytochrome c oxidase N-terminal domain-containing protein n=1 Tax=Dokdonia sp. Asnod3-C12 TaxID=3160575 RepID=UPI003868D7AA
MRTTASFLRILGFSLLGYFLIDYVGTTGETSIFLEQPWVWAILGVIMLFYTAGEVSMAALRNVLYKTLKPEAQAKFDEEEALAEANQFKWIKEKYKASLGSKEIAQEHEIILDHNYDGIQELDNNLPPWWVYMFYASIVFAVIYLVRFEVLDDYNQAEEYEVAVAEAKAEIEEWKKTAKDLVDVNTVTLLTDASDINAGKAIFTNNCIACHKADGGGGIGPNLTDQHWILGGGIKNVFKTISEGGRDGKGMISWKSELKAAEMAQVASFVLSLQGTTPTEPKEAEGELWVNPDAPAAPIKDVVTDSTAVQLTSN